MAQLSLFTMVHPHEYIIDTSSIISQKPYESHRRTVYRSLWANIEVFMKEQKIVTCSEIKEEIKDKDLLKWLLGNNCIIFDVDDEIQENVIQIVTEFPKLITFENGKSAGSSGDAFMIATAIKYGLTVITEENKDSPKKVPKVCESMGIPCLNIDELCSKEGWEF